MITFTFPTQKPIVIGGAVVLGVVLIAAAVFGIVQGRRQVDPQQAAREEVAHLVAVVGKLYALPEGETPVVATVSDPSKLAGQPFFARAKKGDKVLIYNEAGKAILYDPVANILVEVAPLTLGVKPTVTP